MKIFILISTFLFSVWGYAQAPQFVELNTSKSSYIVGDRAVLMASIRTNPTNPNDELFLKSTLVGSQIKLTKLSDYEAVHVTPTLAVGNYLWEVKAYVQNKAAAQDLTQGIIEADALDIKLARLYADETDSTKRAKLQDAIAENAALKVMLNEQLDAGRVLVETKQKTLSVTSAKRKSSFANPITITVDHSNQIYYFGQSAYVAANVDHEEVETDEDLIFETEGFLDNQFVSRADPMYGYFGFYISSNLLPLGERTIKVDLYSRNRRNANSLRSARENAGYRKTQLEYLRDTATSPAMADYYQKEVDELVLVQSALGDLYMSLRTLQASASLTISVENALVTNLASAVSSSCAIKGNTLSCWGSNSEGQLGVGYSGDQNTPAFNDWLGEGVSQIAMYDKTTCAIKSGSLYCWGFNMYGQVGNNSNYNAYYPTFISFPNPVTKVATGPAHSCAVSGGTLYCWGDNTYGQWGSGNTISSWNPVQITTAETITDVVIGNFSTCVITASGKLLCSGWNGNGQLGDGTTTNRTSFVQTIASGVTSASVHNNTGCAVVSGGARCWGAGGDGRVGNGTTSASVTSPVIPTGLGSGVSKISVGFSHTCAVVTGAARCWGTNTAGLLGNGVANGTVVTTPTAVANMTSGVELISTGTNTTCLVKSGVLNCWGLNSVGQLGNGTNTNSATPVQPSVPIE